MVAGSTAGKLLWCPGGADGRLHKAGFRGGVEKCLDAGYILRVKLRGFVDKLDARR